MGKNIWYASISNVIPAILTYAFWFVAARFVGPEAIGHTSAIASFVMIVTTIDVLNMSLGMKRYLGIASADKDKGRFKQIIASTVLLTSILMAASIAVLLTPSFQVLELLSIDRQYVWIIIAMIPAMAFQQIFNEALVAAMKSKHTVIPMIIGSIARFPVLFVAIYAFGSTSYGVIISYSLVLFVTAAFYVAYTFRIFRGTSTPATTNLFKNIKLILHASLASWVPHIISVLGSQLGIITVFSVVGAAAGGQFYIPMAMFMASLFIVGGINRVSHALIAGMEKKEQQTEHASYSLKIAFIFTLPIASTLFFFAGDYLSLMGREFGDASEALAILMISLPMVIISEIVYYFAYGRGDHGAVLRLGIAGNVPRTVLYFVLVPMLSVNGAALAYLVGSMSQLVLSIYMGKRHDIRFDYKSYAVAIAVPVSIGFVMWQIGLHYAISTVVIIIGSFLAFVRIHVFTDTELRNLLFASLPTRTAERIYPVLSRLMNRID